MNSNNDRKGRSNEIDGIFYPVAPMQSDMPEWYADMLQDIKDLVIQERMSAMWSANIRMNMMYYHIGQNILMRQEKEGWGTKVIDRLSADMKSAFPKMCGFSPRNLKYMQRFAKLWTNEEIVQRTVAQLPWRHNICLMEKCKESNRRLVYAMGAIKYGWSKNVLELQLENYTLEREGKLPENFDKTLPDNQSDMVRNMFKDPYLLDFTGADAYSREKDIEDSLTHHITKFLLELGQGFSFVGRQVHLEMEGQDYYIDMLFYHLTLRRFIVVELKAVAFKPEMMGQLAFYQTVVDHTLRHETDEPTIGLLLVKSKSETIVRYSLESVNKPIGVASWETQLSTEMSDKWKSALPTIEEIERELGPKLKENNDDGTE